MAAGEPIYFETPAKLRAWFKKYHAKAPELLMGFWKVDSGRPCVTWPQSVDEALCVGWIDGVRKRIDDERYTIRFTPRRPGSLWSAVNIRRVQELTDRGLIRPAGVTAFEARSEKKSRIYAYEQKESELDEASAKKLRKHKAAWAFFRSQPAWYRKQASWWVTSAKRDETRRTRLEKLIADSAEGRRS